MPLYLKKTICGGIIFKIGNNFLGIYRMRYDMIMKIVLITLITYIFTFALESNAEVTKRLTDFEKCKNSFSVENHKNIIKNCLHMTGKSTDVETYKVIAELFEQVNYERINSIFDYGEADPLIAKMLYNKKLYTSLEKYYLTQAFKNLELNSQMNTEFINLIYAKLSSITNSEYFDYLQKSADLGFYKSIMLLKSVEKWKKYKKKLRDTVDLNDKDSLYKIGMQQFNSYIDSNYKRTDLLDSAIVDFEKSQSLGHKGSLATLIAIYARNKQNKERYFALLKEEVSNYGIGYLLLGNYYWCNGNKVMAKEMFVKSKDKGGLNASEASYSLEDLNKLDAPYNGCLFKVKNGS